MLRYIKKPMPTRGSQSLLIKRKRPSRILKTAPIARPDRPFNDKDYTDASIFCLSEMIDHRYWQEAYCLSEDVACGLKKSRRRGHKPDSVPRIAPGRRPFIWEPRCRGPRAANPLRLSLRKKDGPSLKRNLFGLAPGGGCQALPVTRQAGRLLPCHFTLTAAFRRRRYHFCGPVPGVAPGRR